MNRNQVNRNQEIIRKFFYEKYRYKNIFERIFKRHIHDWKRIETTYAPPKIAEMEYVSGLFMDVMQKLAFGVTTILWECQDKNCRKLRKEEMLGKQIEKLDTSFKKL